MTNSSEDILITLLSKNKKINGYICSVFNTSKTLQETHNYNIISNAIFCRALTAGVLLSGNLKNNKDELFLKWNCTGPIETIVVEVNFDGIVRGFVGNTNLSFIENSFENGSIKAEPYIGFGDLIVTRKTYDDRPAYNSVTNLETGEIANDISVFIKQSLQIDSAIKIGLSIDKDNNIEVCGGLLLMAMPDADDNEIKEIYDNFTKIDSFTDILKNIHNENDLVKALDDFGLEATAKKVIKYQCKCNREKIIALLKSLKPEQFTNYILDNGKISATCEFCNKVYEFDPKDF